MALYSRVHSWVSNEVLTASDLNAEFNNILTNSTADSMIGTSANVAGMQTTVSPGGVGTESLASNITGELQRLRYMMAYVASNNGSNWYDRSAARNLGVGKLGVTRADMAALGQQISSSSGAFTMASATPADVTNLSVSITTTGRPVFVGLMDDGSGSQSALGAVVIGANPETSASIQFYLLRGATQLCQMLLQGANTTTEFLTIYTPPSSVWIIDVPAAGTYTYKLQVASTGATHWQAEVRNTKLIAYEMA